MKLTMTRAFRVVMTLMLCFVLVLAGVFVAGCSVGNTGENSTTLANGGSSASSSAASNGGSGNSANANGSATGTNSSTSANNNSTQTDVVIGTLATEDILPMWVAESEGLFQDAGVNARVETFQSATELIAALTSGDVQMAMTDVMVTASVFASKTDVQIEWITLGTTSEQGRFGIMTADESITELSQLAGEPIGVGSNTILEYVMDTLMTRAGVAEDDIKKEELQKLTVRYQAMASRQVKAAALPASLLALGEANGMHTVADDTQGENISQSVMVANSNFAESEAGAKAVEEVRSAWNESAERINGNPAGYRAMLAKKANLSDDIARDYKVNDYPLAQKPTQSQVDNVLDWMKKKGYLDDGITYDASTGKFSGR